MREIGLTFTIIQIENPQAWKVIGNDSEVGIGDGTKFTKITGSSPIRPSMWTYQPFFGACQDL